MFKLQLKEPEGEEDQEEVLEPEVVTEV